MAMAMAMAIATCWSKFEHDWSSPRAQFVPGRALVKAAERQAGTGLVGGGWTNHGTLLAIKDWRPGHPCPPSLGVLLSTASILLTRPAEVLNPAQGHNIPPSTVPTNSQLSYRALPLSNPRMPRTVRPDARRVRTINQVIDIQDYGKSSLIISATGQTPRGGRSRESRAREHVLPGLTRVVLF